MLHKPIKQAGASKILGSSSSREYGHHYPSAGYCDMLATRAGKGQGASAKGAYGNDIATWSAATRSTYL